MTEKTEGDGGRWGPVVSTPSQCGLCTHFSRGGDFPTSACSTYMGGIPDEILMNDVDHRTPYDGDDGVTFSPAPDADPDVLARVYFTLDQLPPRPRPEPSPAGAPAGGAP